MHIHTEDGAITLHLLVIHPSQAVFILPRPEPFLLALLRMTPQAAVAVAEVFMLLPLPLLL
jgi:hypothetical protein